MKEIIAQAPIQTRGDTLNFGERYWSLLVAEAINRVREYVDPDKIIGRWDFWNTYGDKVERNLWDSSESDWDGYIGEYVGTRYGIVNDCFGITDGGRISVRDDDKDYKEVVTGRLDELIREGKVVVKEDCFHYCKQCDYVISPAVVGVSSCPRCDLGELEKVVKTGLFIRVDSEDKNRIRNTCVSNKVAKNQLLRCAKTLPEELHISKQRRRGVDLTQFGIDQCFKLDPKFSLAMMGLYVRSRGTVLKSVVLGIDSLNNMAPYSALVDDSPPSFIVHGTVPRFRVNDNEKMNKGFLFPFLSLISLSFPRGIEERQRDCFLREYENTIRRIKHGRLSENFSEAVAHILNFAPRKGYEYVMKNCLSGMTEREIHLLYGKI